MPAIFRFYFLHFCTKTLLFTPYSVTSNDYSPQTTASHRNHPGNCISYLPYDIQ